MSMFPALLRRRPSPNRCGRCGARFLQDLPTRQRLRASADRRLRTQSMELCAPCFRLLLPAYLMVEGHHPDRLSRLPAADLAAATRVEAEAGRFGFGMFVEWVAIDVAVAKVHVCPGPGCPYVPADIDGPSCPYPAADREQQWVRRWLEEKNPNPAPTWPGVVSQIAHQLHRADLWFSTTAPWQGQLGGRGR
jgi:hypothetical protein